MTMDRLSLLAEERKVLGKKVKTLRRDGKLPGHVFGKGLESESVEVLAKEFIKIFHQAGETGLIDLKIGKEKIRPVLIREVQYNPLTDLPLHVDFYQVNLAQKVKVSVPVVQVGEPPEAVHLGEAIVLQTLNEVEVESLPADLPEKLEVDITPLKAIDDAITLGQLSYDRTKITISADPLEVVVKLAPAVSAETEKLLEEEAAQQAAAQAEEGAAPVEGEAPATEGETTKGGSAPEAKEEAKEAQTRPSEESNKAE